MSKKNVDVIGVLNGTQFEWQLGGDVSAGGPLKDKKTTIGRNTGPHYITYKISGSATSDVTFSDDPIWISAINSLPKIKASHSQIAWKVKNNGKELMLFDWNSEEVDLYYQLNFDGAPPLDPIIQNGGGTGGQPIFDGKISAMLLFTALVAFALGVLAYKLFFAG